MPQKNKSADHQPKHVMWSDSPPKTIIIPMLPEKQLIKKVMPEYESKDEKSKFTTDQELDLRTFLNNIFKEQQIEQLITLLDHPDKSSLEERRKLVAHTFKKYEQYKKEDPGYDPDGIIWLFLDALHNKAEEQNTSQAILKHSQISTL